LVRGITYVFNLNVSGHPFQIKTLNTTGTGNQYNDGVTNNGTQVGTLIFAVPLNAPNTLYYSDQFNASLSGTINIVDALLQKDGGVLITGSLSVSDVIRAREFTGSFSGSFFQGDGGGLFNIPRAALTGDSPRIASGSVTASVSPDSGFLVKSIDSGSAFSGSVSISGSLFIFGNVIGQEISGRR
jgi:hypothetical protein